jgi:putative transcriptional regulator
MTAKRISTDRINRIKIVLAEKNFSQKDLAEKMHMSEISINSMVNNVHQPKLKDLKRIAEILDVDIRELLYPTKG